MLRSIVQHSRRAIPNGGRVHAVTSSLPSPAVATAMIASRHSPAVIVARASPSVAAAPTGQRRTLSSAVPPVPAVAAAAATVNGSSPKLVLGCGSNVVDRFYRVKKMPAAGAKGYFAGSQVEEGSVVGGVTLNHLSWATILGVPTGLLALQGTDATGQQIRATMAEIGVSAKWVAVSDQYSSSVSYIYLQQDGERCIVMAPASTSQIDDKVVGERWRSAVATRAAMLTTEISQVPLTGVQQLLSVAREANLLTMLDVDVPPSVATTEAGLGDLDAVKRVVQSADVVKPTLDAALELIPLLDPKGPVVTGKEPLHEIAKRLLTLLNCKLVALTDGSRGAGMATKDHAVTIPIYSVTKVIDATGAGDAFFGGLLAGLYHFGLPRDVTALSNLGSLASAAGAACVQVLGALPKIGTDNGDSAAVIASLYPPIQPFARKAIPTKKVGVNGTAIIHGSSSVGTIASTSSESKSNGIGSMSAFRESLNVDSQVLANVASSYDVNLAKSFVDIIDACHGHIFVTGIGKSGLVGRRFAASLSSCGVAAEYIPAVEWLHGDLGKLRAKDVVIAISHSGKTAELLSIIPYIKMRSASLLSIVGNMDTTLAKKSDAAIMCSVDPAVEPFGLVPTASVVAQESIANAVLRELIQRRGFSKKDFFLNHPGGTIGTSSSRKE